MGEGQEKNPINKVDDDIATLLNNAIQGGVHPCYLIGALEMAKIQVGNMTIAQMEAQKETIKADMAGATNGQ